MKYRLDIILSLIENGTGVADIGTDHGYIPVTLAVSGYTGKIIATDINSAPLMKAEKYAAENSCIQKIDFRLSDGLSAVEPSEIDTVVIAGMGADLICRILDSEEWICCNKYKLILQPMTKVPVLRYWLLNNGFNICKECFVKQNGRIFNILEAVFTGSAPDYSDFEVFSGNLKYVPESDIELYKENKSNLISEYRKLTESLTGSGRSKKSIYYNRIIDILINGE